MTDTQTTNTMTTDNGKSKGGAPPGNQNRTRHGLRASSLPAGCTYIEGQVSAFRRYVHVELDKRPGGISLWQEATLQSACRHETRALLAARWLRVETELTVDQRIALSRDVSNATDARDRCLKALDLDKQQDPWSVLDGTWGDTAAESGSDVGDVDADVAPCTEADTSGADRQDAADGNLEGTA